MKVVDQCAELMSVSEPWITLRRTYDDVAKIITDETSEVHLAILRDEMIGFAIIKMRGSFVGYIQSIAVRPQHRGQGIGKRFMEYLERRIFSEQPNVFICVSSFNRDARRLYERLGYETIGELRDYIVKGHSEILMRKTVSPLSEFWKLKK
ncbi:MAG: GNAT family N-acetyltransferase [candidate division WOR-3 bacterium]|nr:MAG: GNAT family N-acetyltransferase [candidate division WOR-3 bacterium]